jgi:histidyl-tRNA synthetase
MQKPFTLKGTRDFTPNEMDKRNYIFDTIRNIFYLHGFKQIETPALESLSILLGKYGKESDKLIFKIINSGNFITKIKSVNWNNCNLSKLIPQISEKGLRYDLTVPLARFVAMHRNEISFPFRRFQIQPVWRADRPQRGRYREFVQCDADIIGSTSLLNEIELIKIIDEVFHKLSINISIKINNRKILNGIAKIIGEEDKISDIAVIIDKLDKIGFYKVNKELIKKGISNQSINKLQSIFSFNGSNQDKISVLKKKFSISKIGLDGLQEIETIFNKLHLDSIQNTIEFDLTLVRGLNYYTGTIFEVKCLDAPIGSILGGGRYDSLTDIFGLPNLSGVGISFGADRIFDILNQLNLYNKHNASSHTQILFVNFGEKEVNRILPILSILRKSNINTELYPDAVKIKKQLSYANNNQIPFVAIVGTNELVEDKISLKNMHDNTQFAITTDELVNFFQKKC